MPTPDEIKQHEREAYDTVAETFDAVWARYTGRFAGDLIDLMSPQRGEVVLDVAGGSGAAGLKVAERVSPGGSVVLTDLSQGMLQIAARNAAARGITNLSTRVMDAERLEFPDATFDLVTCTFGLMFFPDAVRALEEARRVLRPGGRLGLAVWSTPERTPFCSVPLAAVVRQRAPAAVRAAIRLPLLGKRVLSRILVSGLPHGPGPGRFSAPGHLEALVTKAGLRLVRRERRAYPIDFDNFEAYWEAVIRGTPAIEIARRLDGASIEKVRSESRARLADRKTGRVLSYNEAILVIARRPDK